jgi:hypothetical protein
VGGESTGAAALALPGLLTAAQIPEAVRGNRHRAARCGRTRGCFRAQIKRRSYIHEEVLTPTAVANELGGGVLTPRAFANELGRGDFTHSVFANKLGVAKKCLQTAPPPLEKRAAAQGYRGKGRGGRSGG